MNREDIIRMAREAGWEMDDSLVLEPEVIWYISQGQIERFAALVASAEREECAKLRDMLHPFDLHNRSEVIGVMNQSLDDYQELICKRRQA